MKNIIFRTLSFIAMAMMFTSSISAAAVFRIASGGNAAAIQSTVDQFRTDLGGANNGVGGSFTTGRREINWDGVPDSFSEPNNLPFNFFNVNSPRGAIFHSTQNNSGNPTFNVSADSSNPSNTAVRFANIDASYSTVFQTFSAERLFHADGSNIIEVLFFVPGTKIPATVSGFGAVFCDVDGSSLTSIQYYSSDGTELTSPAAESFNNGLSFVGVSFNAGERIAKVIIKLGNSNLQSGNIDGTNGVDVVALDDFIYGEPRAAEYHPGDFDGDGFADSAVFRPSAGTFFVLKSGSNTVEFIPFGAAGDIPVNGDFDGDSKADVGIYRPSVGQWWIQRSTAGLSVSNFGQTGDKPVVGDYDKDGKSDIAFWRPSNGHYFVLTSGSNFSNFFAYPWGQNGDLPVGATIAP